MSKIALDTNVLVFLFDEGASVKCKVAEALVKANPIVSAQVVSEFLNVGKRLLKMPKLILLKQCNQVFEKCTIVPTLQTTLLWAEKLIIRYDLQLFDAIIVAAALQANCTILYSEDMHHGLVINDTLTILNPFI